MSLKKDFEAMRRSAAEMDYHFEKAAFGLIEMPLIAALNNTLFNSAAKFGEAHGPSFLRAGIELGRSGQKANHYINDFTHTVMGKGALGPYDAGLELGQKMKAKGMEDGRSDRLVDRLARFSAARRSRQLEGFKEDPSHYGDAFHEEFHPELEDFASREKLRTDPLTDAFAGISQGEGEDWLKRALVRTGIPEDTPRTYIHGAAQAIYGLPAARYVDPRFVTRPLLRQLDESPLGNKLTENIGKHVDRLPGTLPHVTRNAAKIVRKNLLE